MDARRDQIAVGERHRSGDPYHVIAFGDILAPSDLIVVLLVVSCRDCCLISQPID